MKKLGLISVIIIASGVLAWRHLNVRQSPVLDQTSERINLFSPVAGDVITSPLVVTGQARGDWFFEASFPVTLVNWDGLIIAETPAQAGSDWMTTDFVPFLATLEFVSPYKTGDQDFMRRGALILKKDNPSGLPEHDEWLEVPVEFAPSQF